jgi:hypothetical protein
MDITFCKIKKLYFRKAPGAEADCSSPGEDQAGLHIRDSYRINISSADHGKMDPVYFSACLYFFPGLTIWYSPNFQEPRVNGFGKSQKILLSVE